VGKLKRVDEYEQGKGKNEKLRAKFVLNDSGNLIRIDPKDETYNDYDDEEIVAWEGPDRKMIAKVKGLNSPAVRRVGLAGEASPAYVQPEGLKSALRARANPVIYTDMGGRKETLYQLDNASRMYVPAEPKTPLNELYRYNSEKKTYEPLPTTPSGYYVKMGPGHFVKTDNLNVKADIYTYTDREGYLPYMKWDGKNQVLVQKGDMTRRVPPLGLSFEGSEQGDLLGGFSSDVSYGSAGEKKKPLI